MSQVVWKRSGKRPPKGKKNRPQQKDSKMLIPKTKRLNKGKPPQRASDGILNRLRIREGNPKNQAGVLFSLEHSLRKLKVTKSEERN